jgi:hypothetical protein
MSGSSGSGRSESVWWKSLAGRRHARHARKRRRGTTGSTRSSWGAWRREREAAWRGGEGKAVRRDRHAIGAGEWGHGGHASTTARRGWILSEMASSFEGKRCAYEVVLEGIVQEAHLASPGKAEEGYLFMCKYSAYHHGICILTTWEREGRWRKTVSRLIMRKHRICVCLAFSSIGRGDGVDDGLSLLVADFCEGRQFRIII